MPYFLHFSKVLFCWKASLHSFGHPPQQALLPSNFSHWQEKIIISSWIIKLFYLSRALFIGSSIHAFLWAGGVITLRNRGINLTFSIGHSILKVSLTFLWTGSKTLWKVGILLTVIIPFTLEIITIISWHYNYDLILRPKLICKYRQQSLHHLTICVRLFALVGTFKATVWVSSELFTFSRTLFISGSIHAGLGAWWRFVTVLKLVLVLLTVTPAIIRNILGLSQT